MAVFLIAVVFTVGSLHLNDSRTYNPINPGAGVELDGGWPVYVAAGAYLNSSVGLSVYGAVGRRFGRPRVGVGIEAGAVTGYKPVLLPLVFPYVYVTLGRWGLKVNVLPTNRPIVGFQLVRR